MAVARLRASRRVVFCGVSHCSNGFSWSVGGVRAVHRVPLCANIMLRHLLAMLIAVTLQGYSRRLFSVAEGPLDITGDVTGSVKDVITNPIIFPGTKWCGGGDRARSYDDIGIFSDSDRCCRAHDECPDYIYAGEESGGLRNTAPYTRSHCGCDEAFYYCLKNATDPAAMEIGFMYFDVIRVQCFRFGHPMRCVSHLTVLEVTCLKYEEDTSIPKKNRFYHSPSFIDPPKEGEPFLRGPSGDE